MKTILLSALLALASLASVSFAHRYAPTEDQIRRDLEHLFVGNWDWEWGQAHFITTLYPSGHLYQEGQAAGIYHVGNWRIEKDYVIMTTIMVEGDGSSNHPMEWKMKIISPDRNHIRLVWEREQNKIESTLHRLPQNFSSSR